MLTQIKPNTPDQVRYALASSAVVEIQTGSSEAADQHFDDLMSVGATLVPNVMPSIKWVMNALEEAGIDWAVADAFLDEMAGQSLFGNTEAVQAKFHERFAAPADAEECAFNGTSLRLF